MSNAEAKVKGLVDGDPVPQVSGPVPLTPGGTTPSPLPYTMIEWVEVSYQVTGHPGSFTTPKGHAGQWSGMDISAMPGGSPTTGDVDMDIQPRP